jgi:hypothetical protein
VKFGPQLKRKSDYDESKIEEVEEVHLRVSENAQEKLDAQVGDVVTCNGTVNIDNFLQMVILKRVTKLKKV